MLSVGHDCKRLAVDRNDERLVAADVIDVIDEAQLLQQRERAGAAKLSAAIIADRTLAGRLGDHVDRALDEIALCLARHLVLDVVAAAMRAAFMAALRDLLRETGITFARLATEH